MHAVFLLLLEVSSRFTGLSEYSGYFYSVYAFADAKFWLVQLPAVVLATLPVMLAKFYKQNYMPSQYDHVQFLERKTRGGRSCPCGARVVPQYDGVTMVKPKSVSSGPSPPSKPQDDAVAAATSDP